MKNIIVIGLVSLVLFGVAAGLSVWLQSNMKPPDTAHGDDKKKKPAADDHGDGKDKDHADPKAAPDPHAKEKPAEPKPGGADQGEYRRLQMQVVALDLNAQMQDYDRLLKQVAKEMRETLTDRQKALDAQADEVKQAEARTNKTAADLKKTRLEMEADEKANITRIAGMVDQMKGEDAAPLFQQLADTGKLDLAVKVLSQVKPRKAAQIMAAITDPSLAPTLFEKMKTLKPPTAPEAP